MINHMRSPTKNTFSIWIWGRVCLLIQCIQNHTSSVGVINEFTLSQATSDTVCEMCFPFTAQKFIICDSDHIPFVCIMCPCILFREYSVVIDVDSYSGRGMIQLPELFHNDRNIVCRWSLRIGGFGSRCRFILLFIIWFCT